MSSRSTLSLGRSLVFLALLLVAAVPLFAAQGTGAGAAYTWQTALAGTQQLHGVVWDGRRFVAVGDKGAVFTSADGRAWSPVPSGTAQPLAAAAAGKRGLVAVGAQGLLLASPDAQSWSTGTAPSRHASLNGLAFGQPAGKGLYVAVGELGTLLTSRDAKTWSAVASPVTDTLQGVAWGGAKDDTAFVAVGDNGSLLYSRDGKSWMASQPVPANLTAVAWGGSCFVAVGQGGAAFVSENGLTWVPAVTGTSLDLNAITWMGSRFIAVGAAGTILMSTDGKTWQAQQGPTATWLHGVAFSGSAVVAVGDAGVVETATTYAISGTVTLNGTSTGVAGVTITATTGGTTSGSATTAADGTYSITGLPDSTTYTVTPTSAALPAQQYAFQPQFSSVPISGANVTNINFTATALYAISGAITFPSGTTAPYPQVTISVSPSGSTPTYDVNTGLYTIPNLPAGSYTLTPSLSGYVFSPAQATVTVSGNVTQNFQALAAATITGTISDTSCLTTGPFVVTATGGGYTFTTGAIGPGTYSINVGLYSTTSSTYTLKASAASTATLAYTFNPISVDVNANAPVSEDFVATPYYSISGAVTTSGGNPLAGVTVTASSGSPAVVAATATTNSTGAYKLTNLPNGSYTLAAKLSGYAITFSGSTPVNVPCGNVTGQNFTAAPTYSISGTILYNGTTIPVPGVSVTVGGGATPVTTNSSGAYTLPNLTAGTYTVTPTLLGLSFAPPSSSITVGPSQTGVNFTATGTRTITGTVTINSLSVTSVTVSALVPGVGTFTANPAGNGTYSISVPPASGITVTPSLQGYTFTPPNATVDTTTADATGVNFTASTPTLYSIKGNLTVSPAPTGTSPTWTMTAQPGNYQVSIASVANQTSYSYAIPNIANGTYTLTATYGPSCPAYTVSPASQSVTINSPASSYVTAATVAATKVGAPTVSAVSPNSGPNTGGTTVTVTGTNFVGNIAVAFGANTATLVSVNSPTSLTVKSPAGTAGTTVDVIVTTCSGSSATSTSDKFTYVGTYTISGNVYMPDGTTALQSATVTATGPVTATATSATNGLYTLTGLPNGTYTVACTYPGYTFTSQSVTINNAPRTGINFTANAAYSISGTITSGGTGLAGVTVSAGTGLTGTTDASGNYTIPNVPNGTYTVTPTLAGYYFTPASQSVKVNGASVTGVNFTAAAAFTISGTVTAGTTGIPGVTVSAGGGLSATTSASGAYTIANVPPGTYTVTPTLTGATFTPASAKVTITNANATGVNFTALFSIAGKVTSGTAGLAGVTVSAGGSLVATTATDGTYTILNVPPGTYTVTPSKAGYSFIPTSSSVTVTTAPKTGVNFAAVSLAVTASATPLTGNAPLAVTFTSTVTGGTTPYTYDWDFGDGSTHGTTASPSHTYNAGTYSAILTVSDSSTPKVTVTAAPITIVANAVPLAVTATATPTTGVAPLAVAFAANVTGGAAPYTFAWSFGDNTTASTQTVSHTYTTPGTFSWTLVVTDAAAATKTATGSITVSAPVVPPTVTSVTKIVIPGEPFRLKIMGSNFHANCTIYINGVAVPLTYFVSPSKLIAKKGSALKAMLPKGVPVQITVKNNDDGGVSAPYTFIR